MAYLVQGRNEYDMLLFVNFGHLVIWETIRRQNST